MNKKDALPIVIATVIALVVTALVKWLMPGAISPNQQTANKEISMPEIPLMVKQDKKKKKPDFVLFVSGSFKKDEKVILDKLKWEKWPKDAMQPYFIAKDHQGTPLNNGADYSNALKMWANTDIPSGVPLTMSMLTDVDPVKKKEEERKKKEEEEKQKLIKEKEEDFIKKGMRAVTFQIDQRSASATTMLKAGDLVDVLIMEQHGEKTKAYKYKALKILAIDGVTKFDAVANQNQEESGGFLSNIANVSGLMTPKNVTLEIPENLVEVMLKQSSTNGIILSLRSQTEKADESSTGSVTETGNDEYDYFLQNILSINDTDPSSIQQEEAARRQKEAEDMRMIMDNIISVNSKDDGETEARSFGKSKSSGSSSGGQYEIVSGKIVGNEVDDSNSKSATVYRKLTASKVQFDENGKVTTSESGAPSSEAGSSNS